MSWIQLTIATDAARAEMLSQALEAAGALSVTLLDAADQPVLEPRPGETPIWVQTRVVALFTADTDLAPLEAALTPHLTADERASWHVEPLADQAWERAWLDHFHPLRFGERLWVCPSNQEPPDPDAVIVRLDPGLAFGTGTHPTTALCLGWLDGANLAGRHVIDYGCGSGILAVAAALLGAATVDALDIDPQALTATRDNAARNGVAERIRTGLPDQWPLAPADVVIANILAGPLIELADALVAPLKPGGDLVLSGLLAEQADDVQQAYARTIVWSPPAREQEWVRLHGVRTG